VTLLLSIFLADILPIFLVASAGFILARRLHVEVRTLSRTTFNALSPCLVFNLLVTSGLGAADFGRMAVFTAGVIALIGVIAWLATRPLRLERPTLVAFLLVVMFSNSGNYGLSAVMFAFGREALAHATVYFVMNAALMFTAGVFLASAGRRSVGQALSGVLKVPPVYAVALASLILATGVQVPTPLMRAVGLLSDAAIPVMLLVLGMQLERGKAPEHPALVGLAAVLALVDPGARVRRGAVARDERGLGHDAPEPVHGDGRDRAAEAVRGRGWAAVREWARAERQPAQVCRPRGRSKIPADASRTPSGGVE
jgi:predicted permease